MDRRECFRLTHTLSKISGYATCNAENTTTLPCRNIRDLRSKSVAFVWESTGGHGLKILASPCRLETSLEACQNAARAECAAQLM